MASQASAPDKAEVFKSLSRLLRSLKRGYHRRGVSLEVDFTNSPFIIFSDQHKGNRDHGDDFAGNDKNYLAALDYYYSSGFSFINLGDCEELWKYKPAEVISKNVIPLQSEARFHNIGKYYRTFGNHDITWKDKLEVHMWFKNIFKMPLPVYEGILLRTHINEKPLSVFMTHGHQGDKMSDNNPLSTWLVSHMWLPLQRYLNINVNTPANDFKLRDRHNMMMYEWSSHKQNLILITGHTHKPVFAAGLYSDHPNNTINEEKIEISTEKTTRRPTYFNTGCCCYNDEDITGIEIANGMISLVKWHWENNTSNRSVLEGVALEQLITEL